MENFSQLVCVICVLHAIKHNRQYIVVYYCLFSVCFRFIVCLRIKRETLK